MDKLKLLIAGLIVIAGIAVYYYFDEWLQLARVGVVVAAVVLAMVVAGTSETGRGFLSFASKAKSEGGKVVWPARKEATSITIYVLIMAFLIGVFIYLADLALFKVVYQWILGV